jgi:acylphosphatase
LLGSGDDVDVSMLVSKKIAIEGSIEDLLDGNVEIQVFNLLYKVFPMVDIMSSAHPLAKVDRLRSRCSSYHDRKLQNSSRKLNSRTSNTTSTIDLV